MKRFSFLKKGIWWFWLFNGILISLLFTGMYATGSKSLTDGLKFGEVCEAPYGVGTYTNDPDNIKDMQLSGSAFRVNFDWAAGKWKYLYMDVDTEAEIECAIDFYSVNHELVFQRNAMIEDGINRISLPGKSFSYFVANVVSPDKVTFTLKNTQIREKEKIELRAGHVMYFVISMLIYSGVVFAVSIVIRKRKLRIYKIIEVLQDIYISVGNALLWLIDAFSSRQKHICRVSLLIFWQVMIAYLKNVLIYSSPVYYKYILATAIGIIFVIAISMLERPLKRVSWNRTLVFYWFLLSIVMCVSDYMISKRHMLMGVVNLVAFGFLYFVWNNMKEPKVFIKELMLSLKGTFIIFCIFSICFRPMLNEMSYPGPSANPNTFSAHLILVNLALLVEIEILFSEKKKRQICIDTVLLLMSLSFTYMTHSSAGIGLSVLAVLLFVRHLWMDVIKTKKLLKIGLMMVILCTLLLPVHMTLRWAVQHVPPMIGKEVEFPVDIYKRPQQTDMAKVEAAEKENVLEQVIYAPAMTRFTNSRNMFWSSYFRIMNVVGHKDMARVCGYTIPTTPHNSMLAIMYRYGVFSGIPYIFLLLSAVYYSFIKYNYKRRDKVYCFFAFCVAIIAILFGLVENSEEPLWLTEWIVFYFMLGYVFPCEDKEEQKCELCEM